MSFCCRQVGSRSSFEVRSIAHFALCFLIPALGWFFVQELPLARLTTCSWANGSWHTLWTGHLLHFNFEHFLWDALMFCVFSLLLYRDEKWRVWIWALIAAPLISLFVFAVDPDLYEYRGLSAIDTMLFVRFCLGLCLESKGLGRWVFGALPLVGLAAKILYEFAGSRALFASDLGPGVVPLATAHLAGAVIGCVWFARFSIAKSWNSARA